jgi:magnesium transporter
MMVVGQLYVSRLIQLSRDAAVANVMDTNLTTINANMDQEEVAYIFKKYALANAPVVDDSGKIVGAISIEDVADFVRNEIVEDISQIGGLTTSGNINARIGRSVANRVPWLFINVFFASLISSAVGHFESTINSMVALAVLLPVITSVGGCSASQSVSSTIRALALREINKANLMRIAVKEMFIALTLGVILGSVSGAVVMFRYGDWGLCGVYVSAVIGTFMVASAAGLLVPVFLQRIRLDPAVVSPVLVSATADAFAYCFFLAVATMVLL